MTEDEAKKKFCPLMPVALGPSGAAMMTFAPSPYNSFEGNAAPARQFNCQGSDCMMWGGDGCGLVRQS